MAVAEGTKDVEAFFNESKVGNSADYGIFKDDTDLIVAVFGFYDDDLQVCLDIAERFNRDYHKYLHDQYSCKQLNR